MATTTISWTEKTWNPTTGCTKVSQGCKFCYAERMAKRLQAMGQPHYVNGFKLTLHPDILDLPATWKKPSRIFVDSMSDLFHEDVPDWFIEKVFMTMLSVNRHTYQVLTKRPERMAAWVKHNCGHLLPHAKHIWLGTSIEDQSVLNDRLFYLRSTSASVRFISYEPALGEIRFPINYLYDIHWLICGGESGPNARPMDLAWARSIRDQCRKSGSAFYMKQLGGTRGKRDKLEDLPEDLRIREYPQ